MAARKMKIEFGLMNIACRRDSAVEAKVELKPLCVGQKDKPAHPAQPLKQDPSYCTTCGEVDRDALVRGFGSGSTWTVLDREAASALTEKKQEFATSHESLAIVAHPAAEFLPATEPGDHVYYVTPEPTSADHYALLVRLIQAHPELSFTGLLALSNGGESRLWVLRTKGDVLVLEHRVRTQSLKAAPAVTGTVNEKLLGMVEASLEMFVSPYDPDTYEDHYDSALREAVAAGQVVTEGTAVAVTSDEDLMAKLAALTAGGK